jgi:hypothetical protein
MDVQCPNCGHYRTSISGGRGCLLGIFRMAGFWLALFGMAVFALSCVSALVLSASTMRLVLPSLVLPLVCIVAGLSPRWLAYRGTKHLLYCHNCAYAWRHGE